MCDVIKIRQKRSIAMRNKIKIAAKFQKNSCRAANFKAMITKF